jgi:hypothetical protein
MSWFEKQALTDQSFRQIILSVRNGHHAEIDFSALLLPGLVTHVNLLSGGASLQGTRRGRDEVYAPPSL